MPVSPGSAQVRMRWQEGGALASPGGAGGPRPGGPLPGALASLGSGGGPVAMPYPSPFSYAALPNITVPLSLTLEPK